MIYLTVGEIAKVLGVSTEMIRFYVREGIITPKQNDQNNYWEYSSDDVMMLSDILFYRDQELTLKDIRSIFEGLEVQDIGNIIKERKAEAREQIERYQRILENLEDWQENYEDELSLIGKFRVCAMPPTLRNPGFFDEESHLAQYLRDGMNFTKEQWRDVSLSFYCNINEDPCKVYRYLSINKPAKICDDTSQEDVIEESAEKSICTQVKYCDDFMDMIRPTIEYATKNGYQLTGDFIGWENTNYYVSGKRRALYRIYAPIK
jgi:DNA-binding transcriptional MerR regulator